MFNGVQTKEAGGLDVEVISIKRAIAVRSFVPVLPNE
jgi:hypothetical protein